MPGIHFRPADRPATLVAGYDGSGESRIALDVAAHAAGPTGRVFVVVCFEEPPAWLGLPDRAPALEESHAQARRLVDELEADAVPRLLTTTWEAEVMAGPPADAILRVARIRDADEIFIGSRGRGRAGALLGSVSHAVLHDADRPVRIITQRAAERLETLPTPVA